MGRLCLLYVRDGYSRKAYVVRKGSTYFRRNFCATGNCQAAIVSPVVDFLDTSEAWDGRGPNSGNETKTTYVKALPPSSHDLYYAFRLEGEIMWVSFKKRSKRGGVRGTRRIHSDLAKHEKRRGHD